MTRDTAVIGLGNMGRGIARNLDRAGRLAAAWDIAEAARTNAGLPPEVAHACSLYCDAIAIASLQQSRLLS